MTQTARRLAAQMLVGQVLRRVLLTGRSLEGQAEPLVEALLRAVAPPRSVR